MYSGDPHAFNNITPTTHVWDLHKLSFHVL